MKKAIALFLLAIMTLTALQPSLALHFCGGNLRSVAIGKMQKSCCETAMEKPINPLPAHAENRFYQPINTCCSTYTIELSTDNFQSPVQQSITDLQSFTFHSILFPVNALLEGIDSPISLTPKRLFPPGGLARNTIDLLTIICIFRI
ncbi:MAG: hypothetical protein LBB64_03910 [Dysgonamonadaceae bacterium]|jgi:hypothetical protein|nr:hypothetical protein [Dysgonamonadaceae bacterium]